MKSLHRRNEPVFMNPAIFIPSMGVLGLLFAFAQWVSLFHMGYHIHVPVFFEAWGFQFLTFGIFCWLMWRFLGRQVQSSGALGLIAVFLPLSVAASVLEEMAFVWLFPGLPMNKSHMGYRDRLTFYLYSDFFENVVIVWCAIFLFRGVGYYQRYREKERAAVELEVQLAQAQISALRMQLNPHFLFNTMNGISSLMRIDVDAADAMLEQLSCLMRMTLERGEAQLITLREELDFIELYLAMQARRYAGRVRHELAFDPELYDAFVPAMLLQPIVENAYVHGLSRLESDGVLDIRVERLGEQVRISVLNSGIGLLERDAASPGHGVGLMNVKTRLRLHYGEDCSFSIAERADGRVEVSIAIPLQLWAEPVPEPAGIGVE